MTKQELRRYIRTQKKQQTVARLAAMSAEICDRVLASAIWQQAGTLLLYHPLADEVDVRPLISDAFQHGRQVLLPVCRGEALELHLYEGEASLACGAFGIMEPTGPVFLPECYPEIELAVIPGMAFDRTGHRLGRGKGYYDRLLPKLANARVLGVCFPFQLIENVPIDQHDVCIDDVITTSP